MWQGMYDLARSSAISSRSVSMHRIILTRIFGILDVQNPWKNLMMPVSIKMDSSHIFSGFDWASAMVFFSTFFFYRQRIFTADTNKANISHGFIFNEEFHILRWEEFFPKKLSRLWVIELNSKHSHSFFRGFWSQISATWPSVQGADPSSHIASLQLKPKTTLLFFQLFLTLSFFPNG